MVGFFEYIDSLKEVPEQSVPEPDLDDIDVEKDRQIRELDDLQSGAIRKGVVEAGEGDTCPCDGDLVFFHLSIKTEDGAVLETTRLEEGGSGVPRMFVIGKGLRAPRGWELTLLEMHRRERAVVKLRPEYGFAQKDFKVKPPKGHAPDEDFVFDIQLVNWYPKTGVRVLGETGDVVKRVVKESESWETPRPPFEVTVRCWARVPSTTGRQGDGVPYFQTRDAETLTFTMGEGRVPPGLEEGVGSLAKGERAIVSCPAESARGGTLVPDPPPDVDRVEYELELVSMLQVRDMTGTGEVTKRRVKDGVGEFPMDCPLEDSAVRVHFKCYSPETGEVFVDTRGPDGNAPALEFDTGMDAVPEAVDMSVRLMTPQEVSIIRSVGRYAYDGREDRPPGMPEGGVVEFELELLGFDKQPNWHTMGPEDKITQADLLKTQGNKVFKRGQLKFAKQKYLKALKLLDHAFDIETDEQAQACSSLKAACHVNLALIAQKETDYTEAFKWCDKALREVDDYPKALYRRGMTHALLNNYEEAEEDLLRAKEVDPSTAAEIDRELMRMKHQRKVADNKQKREFSNFFARQDRKLAEG